MSMWEGSVGQAVIGVRRAVMRGEWAMRWVGVCRVLSFKRMEGQRVLSALE